MGERMLNHALVFLRQWAGELQSSVYADKIQAIEQNYTCLFQYFLSAEDPERNGVLDVMTYDTYRLADEMYAEMRLKRNLSPSLQGFNPDDTDATLRYFSACPRLQDEDLNWLRQQAEDSTKTASTLMVMAAMAQNLRTFFSEKAFLCLIELIGSENTLLSEQALATTILLLAQYDVRIFYFPHLQDAFVGQIGDGEHAFEIMCALAKSTKENLKNILAREEIQEEDLPEEIKEVFGEQFAADSLEQVVESMSVTENEYIATLVSILPDTWVFDELVGIDEERMQIASQAYLNAGMMDMMWDSKEKAEEILIKRLRSEHPMPQDYLNYGHLCFLKGDRLLAYENYREARKRLGSAKKFMSLFRPDRRSLIDNGVPTDEVYLMEDQLLRE